ncbi:MAG: helix-turn-helix domain-containing protein [Armatimonadia bacterium]
MKLIRKVVLGISQAEMASLTETTQATVSRWEKGELEPDRQQMGAIRAAAAARGIEWRDEWFFDAASIPTVAGGAAA